MKKVKLSLAALTLVLAIAGTTTANATKAKKPALCSVVDPKGTICTGGDTYCCTDDGGTDYYYNPFN